MTNQPTLDVGTRLAVERTRLAAERTLMAWVRTAASLISFGFTIYKFFDFELKRQPQPSGGVIGPREFAIAMIVIALAALLMSTIEHRRHMKAMRAEFGFGNVPISTAAVVAGLVSLLGVVTFVAVVFRG